MWQVILNDSSLLLIFIMVGHGLFFILLIDFWVVFSVSLLGITSCDGGEVKLLVAMVRVLLYLRSDPKYKKPSILRRNVVWKFYSDKSGMKI